jgi:hypothetical protein
MKKMSDIEKLRIRKRNLENVVNEIHEHVPYESFDFNAMTRVLEYLSKNYSVEITSPEEGLRSYVESIRTNYGSGVIFYDVGHYLIKEEMQKVLEQRWKDKTEAELVLDGVLGWIYYNPGKSHERQRKNSLKKYSDKYGGERFRERFDEVEVLFKELHSIGKSAEIFNSGRIQSQKLPEADYNTFFRQCSFTIFFLKGKDYFKELYEGRK